MASDFQFVVGTHKTCVPSAKAADGTAVAFPEGTVFAWTSSDPLVEFNDPTSASPDIVATAPVTGVVVSMQSQSGGFSHSVTHTVDAVAQEVDPIGTVDFMIQ